MSRYQNGFDIREVEKDKKYKIEKYGKEYYTVQRIKDDPFFRWQAYDLNGFPVLRPDRYRNDIFEALTLLQP